MERCSTRVILGFACVVTMACSSSEEDGWDWHDGGVDGGIEGASSSDASESDGPHGTRGSSLSCVFSVDPCFATAQFEAAYEAYVACQNAACDPEIVACYGADYQDGVYDGDCAAYATCFAACDCDWECVRACPVSAACKECVIPIIACEKASGCEFPTLCDKDGG